MSNQSSEDPVIDDLDESEHRGLVRERYSTIATESSSCCGPEAGTGSQPGGEATDRAIDVGYDPAELGTVPDEANLGLGCGNPTAIANLRSGETVVDLGSGAGFDCFLAARAVGESGHVIGVDMTPEMIDKARANARDFDGATVEFRLGEIEHLPVGDEMVDVILSNCVINLSPSKQQVFDEAYRILKPGGRLAVTDVVKTAPIPGEVASDPTSISRCIAGAERIDTIEAMLDRSGFDRIEIVPKNDSDSFIREWDSNHDLSAFLVSARISAIKPTV